MVSLSTMARHSRRPVQLVFSTFPEVIATRTAQPSSPSSELISSSMPSRRSFANTPIAFNDPPHPPSPDEILSSFANLDHQRASRAGFPEAVFGQGKTPKQIHAILESMADNVNKQMMTTSSSSKLSDASKAILATRVDKPIYEEILRLGPLQNGQMEYHETARLISVRANSLILQEQENKTPSPSTKQSVIVACAGTTDLPIAEEAALTLSLSSVPTTRLYDCGVAGLHRILSHLPALRDPSVGCVIVCAGMDGALPSVVGGLVDVPVVAVPTSVGYGMSLGGMSAMLTMLNSCSPGVGVVNVDNGFGGAVLAMKCLRSRGG